MKQTTLIMKTVHPVSDDIAIEELSDFMTGTELEPCTQEEKQLISKNTVAYIAADHSPGDHTPGRSWFSSLCGFCFHHPLVILVSTCS